MELCVNHSIEAAVTPGIWSWPSIEIWHLIWNIADTKYALHDSGQRLIISSSIASRNAVYHGHVLEFCLYKDSFFMRLQLHRNSGQWVILDAVQADFERIGSCLIACWPWQASLYCEFAAQFSLVIHLLRTSLQAWTWDAYASLDSIRAKCAHRPPWHDLGKNALAWLRCKLTNLTSHICFSSVFQNRYPICEGDRQIISRLDYYLPACLKSMWSSGKTEVLGNCRARKEIGWLRDL